MRAPAGAVAGRVRLVADAAGATHFDGAFNEAVSRRLEWLFTDGFESGDTTAWSAATP